MKYPYRLAVSGPGGAAAQPTATMVQARNYLSSTLAGYGLEVVEQAYSARGTNVLGIQPGTQNAKQWVVLSCHYDTASTSVYGAWDDGAGCAALLEMARTFSTFTWNRTIVYAFFDEEESGLVGSRAFVQAYAEMENVTLAANLNFDPPSLNYPCRDAQGYFPVKIIIPQAKVGKVSGFQELADAIEFGINASGIPREVVDYDAGIPIATVNGQGLRGTSDHANFDRADIPNVYIGGTPTTTVGPVAALTYLLHTPLDTVQQMEARCGGADLLKGGFQTTLDLTRHAMVYFDQVAYVPAAAEPAA